MNYEDATNAIRSRWAANLGATTTTLYDTAPGEKPSVDDTWVRFNILYGSGEHREYGSTHRHRRRGRVVVQIFVPVKAGDGAAIQLADQVSTLFQGVNVGGVRFQTVSLGEQPRRDGAWWQLNVNCPFWFDNFS